MRSRITHKNVQELIDSLALQDRTITYIKSILGYELFSNGKKINPTAKALSTRECFLFLTGMAKERELRDLNTPKL